MITVATERLKKLAEMCNNVDKCGTVYDSNISLVY